MTFITNRGEEQNLKKRIVELVEKSQELKFLVGFFYFSGISELHDSLKKRDDNFVLRILVGLNVDYTIGKIAAEYAETETQNRREVASQLIASVPKAINSDSSDNKDKFEQLLFFVELLERGKIVIRKTRNPNHSKLYLFDIQPGELIDNAFITGSSNLTSAGLSTQEEFNVEIKDHGYDKADKFFEGLWEEAVKITEDDAIRQDLIETIKKHTLIREVTPFEAYVLVLKIYLDTRKGVEIGESLKQLLKKLGYTAYKYQEDAVRQAKKTLETYDGVIIADVVGLGKSIVASMLAKETNKRGVILCPPGLIPEWERYREEFELFSWQVVSSGNIKQAQEFINKANSRVDVVVLDEAHRFRNDDTSSYKELKTLCREKKVVLLSATPFNNSPSDILSLLELFTIPKKSSITLDGNVKATFRTFKTEFEKLSEIKKHYRSANQEKRIRAEIEYKKLFEAELPVDISLVMARTSELATQIRSVIEPVAIRRNRLDLMNHPEYGKEVTNLSEVTKPQPWYYELTAEQSDFYDKVLTEYFGENGQFKGAVYRPFVYQTGITGAEEGLTEEQNRTFYSERNASDFMRRLLVKRFESSFGSFKKSIENFINITEIILKFVKKNDKYIFDRKLTEQIYELDEDELEQKLIEYAKKLEADDMAVEKRIFNVSEFVKRDEFIADIESDIALYKSIHEELLELGFVNNDPKADALIEKIKGVLNEDPIDGEPKRKVIIFTEYRDTANHLEPLLRQEFGDDLLYSGDMGKETIAKIKKNFDAALPGDEQEDDVQILLATDKVSEGFNLNRAGIVINYDIPWNPVRVIQRVGRINRISKTVFKQIHIVNFFPSEQGKSIVQTEEIAANKMYMIHNILGEDSRIFHPDEEPSPAKLFEKLTSDPDDEDESLETKIVKRFTELQESNPQIVASLEDMPTRVKVGKKYQDRSLLIFSRRERLHVQRVSRNEADKTVVEELPLEIVLNQIECGPEESRLQLSDNFWDDYAEAKKQLITKIENLTPNSIEQKCINLLSSYKLYVTSQGVKDIAQVFLEDIVEYGTLSLPTMREIVDTEKLNDDDTQQELQRIVDEQGGIDYLSRIKVRIKDSQREIVVAIENQ